MHDAELWRVCMASSRLQHFRRAIGRRYKTEYEFGMSNKTALVFGAGGFIGNHLVARLKHEGF